MIKSRGKQTTAHFVNKVLLKHCHAHSVMYYLWLFLWYMAELVIVTETV